MLYIGVDLGGTNIAAGLVDEEGHILHKCSVPTGVERGAEAVIADMAALCQRIIDETGNKASDIKAIGVGVPGICHPSNGVVEFCTNLFWHQVPLREIMNRTLDIPVYIGNDATVAGLAESVAGVSKGVANSVFLTLGTGVGGGIVVDHKVYSGTHGIGSELGHMVIVADGEPCTCGNHGCWERYTSATAMIRMGREAAAKYPDSAILTACGGNLDKLTAKMVMDAAKAGDSAGVEVFKKYVHYLAVGIVSIINILDPEVIAIGGGVSAAGEFLRDAVRAEVDTMIFCKEVPYARIEIAVLGNDAGIIGAAMLGK